MKYAYLFLALTLGCQGQTKWLPACREGAIRIKSDGMTSKFYVDGKECDPNAPPKAKKPEPIDVPAVKGKARALKTIEADHAQCPDGYEADWNYNRELCAEHSFCTSRMMCYPTPSAWTCTDTSRGLWASVDGKHWCHKPQP